MRFALSLEIIRRPSGALRPKPYVESLYAFTAAHGWSLGRLEPQPDVIDANSVGTRGIMLRFWLPPGHYRVFQHMSWNRHRIIYLRITAEGKAQELTRNDLIACLQNQKSA